MGSKTKYYTDLHVSKMFDNDDNLYGHELARIAASIGSMSPANILPALINDSMMFYNEAVFDKKGVTANVQMSIAEITASGITYYINTNIDPTVDHIIKWFFEYNGVKVEDSILQVYDALKENFIPLGSCSVNLWQEIDNDIWSVDIQSYDISGSPHILRTRDYADKSIPDIQIINDVYGVWMLPIDTNCNVTGDAIHVMIPSDDRAVLAIEYQQTDGDIKRIFAFESDIITSAENQSAFILPFMKNFDMIEDDDNLDFILNRFGLAAEDKYGNTLKESMWRNRDNLKHSFISYSLDRYNRKFGRYVNMVYGLPDGSNEYTPRNVTISGEYQISYRMRAASGYSITIERETKDADSTDDNGDYIPYYIIPVSMLKRQTIPDKFEAYKQMFNMFMYTEKEVEIKWYQTTLFRIIFMVVAVFVGVAMGLISVAKAITMVAMQMVSLALQNIDPRLAAIIGLVFTIVTLTPGNISSIINVVNNAIKVFYSFSMHSMQAQLDVVADEIKDINEDIKDMKEDLADMWREGIYMPLDTMDYMSDPAERFYDYMETSYNQSDMIELAMENMLNPNAKLA